MKLCMFHPVDHPMERGWVGRVEGEQVVQLAAQTLQSFFTGGGRAREHAVYPLAGVRFLAPVLHPPAVRVFDVETSFEFANPAAIVGPGAQIPHPSPSDTVSQGGLTLLARVAAVIGADEAIAGFTALADWRYPEREPPKDRDFALGLGPLVVTPEELDSDTVEAVVRADGVESRRGRLRGFDWAAARELAAEGTALRPGDLLAGPPLDALDVSQARSLELELRGIGVLSQTVRGG